MRGIMNSKYLSSFTIDESLSLGIKRKCMCTVIEMGNGSVDTVIAGTNDADITVSINIRGIDMERDTKWIVIHNKNVVSIYVNDAASNVPFKELEKLIISKLEIIDSVFGDNYHEAFKKYHKVICGVNNDGETTIYGDVPLVSRDFWFYDMPEII